MSVRRLRTSRRRVGVIAAAVAVLLLGGVMMAVNAGAAAAGCRVAYTVASQWQGGFTANVAVTNLGDPVNGWRLAWTFPSGQQVTQAWNASVSTSGGRTTATNASYNPAIPTNGSVSFGFNGSWAGSNAAPTSFDLNGVTCTGNVGQPSPSSSSSTPPQPGDAMATVAAMQPGTNIGNTLDAIPDETSWGNPLITRELLRHYRSQGYRSVRLPVTWTNHHGPAPDYTIDAAWLARVRQVVDWALAEDLYVLLNLHHDSWQWINTYPSDKANVLARYRALWTQISTTFRDHPQRLTFENINEPQFANSTDDQSYPLLHELNVDFVNLVRRTGGNNATRVLVLPTLFTNADQPKLDALLATINGLNDRNLAATIHFYGFWPFSVNNSGFTRYNAEVEQDLIGTFDRVYNTFVARRIPVIMGEWAVLNYDHNRPGVQNRGELLKFFEAVGYQARIRNVTTMLWDAGQFLNRQTLQWRDQGLFDLMKASWTTRSATASSDQVFVARSTAVTNRSLTLNLNGASFQGLRHGNTNLVDGTDYTVSGSTLTLTASALTRLLGDRSYGVKAAVEARFSQGAPWQISVISYDTPIVANANGTTSAFAVPTQFRGDILATMEAKYADGTPAGPLNWTTYKEFWTHVQPDYTAGTLILKPEFFAEVTDGARVTLTFHFWSGAQATCHVTKSGTTVTGTTT
ncbi:cellulase family glycosylhydrolase [Virgisporangium aurantiacum]|uniref:cellulase n=1 Tax=Virgisporangium aurantiacum TaxID=175570 RepID=A0A8J4E646_9ACTN|nr:cellulase family glycosylhydrolase [Virgisporangium aurantiacum]GIJ62829.1 hypothetical protein Vau01_103450 [Virgisporangium aurantiacum]